MTKGYLFWLVLLALLIIVVNFLPFLVHGRLFFGYDYGFYRRYLIQPSANFPNTPVPGVGSEALLPRVFLDFLRLFILSPDIILVTTSFLFTALTVIILFFLVRSYLRERVALISCLLFTLSPVRYTAYWYFFLKNLMALPFFLVTLILLRKKSWWALVSGLAVLLTHHTTSVILIASLGIYFLLARGGKKYIFLILVCLLAVFLFLYGEFYFQQALNLSSGIFLTRKEFVSFSFPILVLAVLGAREFLTKFHSPLFAYAGITLIFPIFSLPFYERVLVFLDIPLIITASLGIRTVFKEIHRAATYSKTGFYLILMITASWLTINLAQQINNLHPPLAPAEIDEIKTLSATIPQEASILTSAIYAPWIQGWTLNRVFAPTILNDQYTHEQWLSFWKAENHVFAHAFLKQFSKPLYLFLDKSQQEKLLPLSGACFEPISKFVFFYQC